MAENTEDQERDPASKGPGVDSIALALTAASRDKADAVLERQRKLLDLQIEDAREQHALQLSHLRLRRFSDYSKMALEVAVGLFILVMVGGFSVMVRNATLDHDLIIDPISTPTDLAARGLTGQVVASELLDKYGQMQRAGFAFSNDEQNAGSYRSDSGRTIKIAIPQTGVSIGELDQYLRSWLGHETHVGGEIVRTPTGLKITTRFGTEPGSTILGSDSDIDSLLQKAAESIFASARPLLYSDYLIVSGRAAEADRLLQSRSMTGSSHERALVFSNWAVVLESMGDWADALSKSRTAVQLDPQNAVLRPVLAWIEANLGHSQQAYENYAATLLHWTQSVSADETPQLYRLAPIYYQSLMDFVANDPQAAAKGFARFFAAGSLPNYPEGDNRFFQAYAFALDHDPRAARQVASVVTPTNPDGTSNLKRPLAQLLSAMSAGEWRNAVSEGQRLDKLAHADPSSNLFLHHILWPQLAYSLAMFGDIDAAEALSAKTPLDDDWAACMRARIAAIRHDWKSAAYLFAMVDARAPSIPLADSNWGEMLLHKGDYDAAIAKFTLANQRGPHFADPLEMWGEALMLKNRSDLALAKFQDAAKYAPNWGRLHMKWGEALGYLGRREEARAQYRIASTLDLNVTDSTELARDRRL